MTPAPRTITVATNHGGYATDRNIVTLPFKGVKVIRALNAFRIPNYLYFKLFNRLHPLLLNHEWDYGLGSQDILHTFNGVCLGRSPWVCTFETILPRWGAYGNGNLRWGMKQLAKPACKQLIALSQCNADIQRMVNADYPDYRDAIDAKLVVQHPQQPLLLDDPSQKAPIGDCIEMALTGADFFRKGGLEVLRVLDRLYAKGAPIRMHIVSAMHTGDYASKAGTQELEEAKAIIARHPDKIVHYPGLPYHKVLELFRKVHVGLLPTWADTYGYTVLEAQAAACPVVTTNVRALPEVNGTSTGWMIPVRLDERRNAVLHTEQDRKQISEEIQAQLAVIFQSMLDNPAQIAEKGRQAWERIRRDHNPHNIADRIEGIYRKALGWA